VETSNRGGKIMSKLMYVLLAIVAVTVMLLSGCGGDNNYVSIYTGKFVYANTESAPNYVSGFAIKADGSLESLPGSTFATGGNGAGIAVYYAANRIALAPTRNLLFASNSADNTITSFTLDPCTGELTAVGTPVASGGTMGLGGSLAVDKDGNFLFVGNDTTADISVFAIAATGALTPVAGSPFALPAAFGPDGIVLNAVGNTLYVAGATANALAVLSVAANGTLTPIAGSPFAYTGTGTISSFAFASPTLGLAASFGGLTSDIASYSIGANGAPTLLHSLTLGINNQSITTARSGQLAVVSGGGVANISIIQVASDGTLAQVAGSPFTTAAVTSGYALVNPSGSFLYATEVNQIEAFKINAAGALTSINTYPLITPGVTTAGFATGLVIY
jgi:hypothetical protein